MNRTCRSIAFALLMLLAGVTSSRGQVAYGPAAAPQVQPVYDPALGGFVYGYAPAAYPGGPQFVVPATYYYGTGAPSEQDQPACTTCSDPDDGGEALIGEDGCPSSVNVFRDTCLAGLLQAILPYSETGCCAPHWFDIHAEAVFLRRNADEQFWEFVRLGPLGQPLITSANLDFDMEPSARVTGTFQTGPGSNLEFTYLGFNDYSRRAIAVSDSDLLYAVFDNFSIDDNGFPDPNAEIEQLHQAERQEVRLYSDFDTVELNYRRRWIGPTCMLQGSWLAGVRYFQLEDTLRFFSVASRDAEDPPGEDDTGGTADFFLRTRNYMTGFQLGGDAWLCLWPGLRLGLDTKGGVFGNNVKVNTVMTGTDPDDNFVGLIAPEALGNDKISFVGEASLLLTYQLNHQFTLRGGYQMLFVEGVATAMDNFNPTTNGRTPVFSDGASIFYDGFSIGAEWMW